MRSLSLATLLILIATPLSAFSGLIYDASGRPMAGVTVSAQVPATPDSALARLIDPSIAPPAILASATTDDGGAFQLAVKGTEVATIVVSAEGHLPWRSIERIVDEEITISLQRLTLRTGRVQFSGKPVANALVSFLNANYEILASYKTDAGGSYSAPEALGWASMMCVTHRDYAPVCQAAYGSTGLASADVTLSKGKDFNGRVTDENGRPVAGVVVRVDQWPLARSGEDGAFTIAHAPESTKLYASGEGRAGIAAMVASPNVTVTRAHSLTGTVTDSKGRGLAGVPVMAAGSTAGVWLGTVTDAKGAYNFTQLAPDQYTVAVNPPAAWETEPAEVDLRRGDAKKSLVVRDAPFITGTVIDESKKPVEAAAVTLLPKEMPVLYGRLLQFPRTTTGKRGTFRLRTWEGSEQMFRVIASKDGYAAGSAPLTAKGGIAIVLPAGVEVSGVVVDAEGNPEPNASVVAAEATQMLNTMPLGAALASGFLAEWTRTDSSGGFVIRVNPGKYDFGVWKKGFAAADVGSVEATTRTEALRVVLGPAIEVRGRVLKKDGTPPAAGGTITAMRTGSEAGVGQTTLSPDGSFVFDALVAGPYILTVQSEDGTTTKTITAPSRDIMIELPALMKIRGRVRDKATGSAIQSFTVVTSNMDARHYRRNDVAEASGVFEAEVPAGPVEVEIESPGFAKATREITVTSRQMEGLDFELERGRRIIGRVMSADGAAVEEATVTLGREEYSGEMATTSDDGSFELEGAPVDELLLSVRGRGYLTVLKKVPAGSDDQRIDVSLSVGRRLSGKVVDASGAAVPEASVSASSEAHGAEHQSTTSGSDGTFTLSGLIDAHYDLHAEKEGAGEGSLTDIDVKSGKTVLLRLVATPTGTIHGSVEGASGGDWMMGMVHARGLAGGSSSAQIKRDGTYRIEHVPAGEIEVTATLMAADREITSRKVQTTLPSGSDIEVNLPAAGNITITGRVTADGNPVPAQSVTFSTAQGHGRWRALTGEDGTYKVDGLEAGRYWIQVGSRSGRDHFQTQHDVTGSGTYDINTTRTNLEGRVIDAAGAPVPGATISAAASGGDRSGSIAQTTSDESGRFTLALLANSSYRLTAAKSGFVNGTTEVDPHGLLSAVVITLRPGEGQTIILADARSGATLAGYVVVTDETGRVTFPVTPEKREDGSLRLALPEGRYRISASASEYASRTVRVDVPSPPIMMTLTPGGHLVVNAPTDARHLVRLVQPDGDEYVRCYCNGIAEIRLEGATTRVPNVAPGSYRMDLLDTANRVVRSYPVTIAEGQTTTIDATK